MRVNKYKLSRKQIEVLRSMTLGVEYRPCELNCPIGVLRSLEHHDIVVSEVESCKPFLPRVHTKFRLKEKITLI